MIFYECWNEIAPLNLGLQWCPPLSLSDSFLFLSPHMLLCISSFISFCTMASTVKASMNHLVTPPWVNSITQPPQNLTLKLLKTSVWIHVAMKTSTEWASRWCMVCKMMRSHILQHINVSEMPNMFPPPVKWLHYHKEPNVHCSDISTLQPDGSLNHDDT